MQKQTYEYKKAGLAQIDELVRTRLVVLRAANQLSDAVDLSQVASLRGKRALAEKILDQDPCLQ